MCSRGQCLRATCRRWVADIITVIITITITRPTTHSRVVPGTRRDLTVTPTSTHTPTATTTATAVRDTPTFLYLELLPVALGPLT